MESRAQLAPTEISKDRKRSSRLQKTVGYAPAPAQLAPTKGMVFTSHQVFSFSENSDSEPQQPCC